VRDQIVAETHGNPLALLELPLALNSAELAGGFGLLGALLSGSPPVTADASVLAGIEVSFQRRVDAVPIETARLLLLAAADPTGDPTLVWQAASLLSLGTEAAMSAAESGLAEFGPRVRFRHPLVRAVVYRSATPALRREVHDALAKVTDPATDPDRRAWHRAQAVAGPDDGVAAELERSAGRARARGGLAAAAAFLERAAMLTRDPPERAGRALAAAGAKAEAGAIDAAQDLLAMAETGPLTEIQRAHVNLLRANLAYATDRGGEAPLLLVRAAKQFEPIDAGLARATYLNALAAAAFAGRLAHPGGHVLDVARVAAAAPRPLHVLRPPDLLLEGLAANFTGGYAVGVPTLQQAVTAFGSGMSADEPLRWLWLATETALHLWDDEHWDAFSTRYLQLARTIGALSELPLALSTRAYMLLFTGDLAAATPLVEEQRTVTEATGSNLAPYSAMFLAALRGRQAEVSMLVDATREEVADRGEGIGIAVAEWTNAVVNNGLGNYSEALAAARRSLHHAEYPRLRYPGIANWAAPEFVEAAARTGLTEDAEEASRWIAEMADASRTDWALGVAARSRALLAEGEAAEMLYQEAIRLLSRTRIRTDLARAHLLYGEWLRRERRRTDAREQLRTALGMLETMAMTAFADRARRDLRATGATARKRTVATATALTAQEDQIAQLARDGLSNPEIATRLFISARTVQYHLRNVFSKLGITSRSQLDRVLS
jgi:DNA-binding CsgD family transcriptional regulator